MRWLMVGWIVLLSSVWTVRAEIPRATDAPRPQTPANSQKTFRLPEGFRIELVAAEPMLAEPTGMCFDAAGNIYVCELHGYNLDGYYDVLELNKSGVLDRAVRRIPASRKASDRAERETHGTVRRLETNAEGKVIRSSVFAEHLPACYGVVPARDGVLAIAAPDIYFLADRSSSGKADVREKLFTGFGVGEIWTRISNPRWGPDNWIYVACGAGSGGTITGPHLKEPVKLPNGMGFRFKADGSRLEPVTGGTSGYGLAFDDFGDRFLCTNQQHALHVAPLPYAGLARNPYSPGIQAVHNISSDGHPARVFPTSKPDPWRLKRGQQAEWVKFYGAAETCAGLFTSACAPCIYQADRFPEAYRHNHFSCEPAQNLVHRCVLEARGTGFTARRADKDCEFLTSTDPWFRPVNLTLGPDGALYVVDMYREIIEDYSAIPRYLQQEYVESLVAGRDRGRIWRIRAGPPERTPWPNLQKAGGEVLLNELSSANVWRRLTAQRLLIERADKRAAADLVSRYPSIENAVGRMHALYTLDALGALTSSLLAKALADRDDRVRPHALALAEPRLQTEPDLLTRILKMTDDPHPRTRLQLAFTLGASPDPAVLPALAALARRDGSDAWAQTAILSAVSSRAGELLTLLATDGPSPLLVPLAAVVGARNDEAEIADLLFLTKKLEGGKAGEVRKEALVGLRDGLKRAGASRKLSSRGQEALEALLIHTDAAVRKAALPVAQLLNLQESPALKAHRARARDIALDERRSLAERVEATGVLAGAPLAELAKLPNLLDARQPIELQLAVIEVFAANDAADAATVLLKNWSGHSPRIQAAVMETLLSRRDRLPLLLDAIESGTIESGSVPAVRQSQLLDNPDARIRDRARRMFAARAISTDRKPVLEKYRAALALPRDPTKGKAVFENQCQKCHALNGRGFSVGPDLAAVQNRPDESLLVDIFDPSSTITVGFKAYTATTRSGKLYTGVLAAETATSITLRRDQGAEDTILRREIESIAASPKSLMPDGLEKDITPQDLANLLGYLRQELRPKK